ncbi:MAG: YbjQ family protein [Lachnospiraceae bacterium]|nr:YbjQ family protein [Lachnospiraceae bacterium]
MGVCQICGASYGMFSGGQEPYTGKNLMLCSDCLSVLKKIESMRYDDINKCKSLYSELIKGCENQEVLLALAEYISAITGEKEELCKQAEEEAEVYKKQREDLLKKIAARKRNFKNTTGYDFRGYKIVDYKGIVSGEVVLGTGFLSEFAASFSDALGIESGTFAKKMSEAKQGALNNLIMNALLQGGNALIGVDFDYITFSNNILGVSANGTAVVIEKEEK